MKVSIYLDNHATTPLDPRALEAMIPYLTTKFGNAASKQHVFGLEAEVAVEKSRKQIATLIRSKPEEIIFTSGATESNNLAILGVARANRSKGNHLITCTTEHKAVLDVFRALEKEGFRVTFLPVNSRGEISLEKLESAIEEQTILVSLMMANNEVGTIHPMKEIGKITRHKNVLLHVDAAQGAGKVLIDVEEMKIDLLSLSGHKIYGPKGIGALYLRNQNPKVQIAPILFGGGHEKGIRSGTLNVPGVVGMGFAFEIAKNEMESENERIAFLRDRLSKFLFDHLGEIYLNGHPTDRVSNNLNVSFRYVPAELLMMEVKEIALSSGAACVSATREASHVLKAIGLEEDLARGSIRFGLGRFTTEEEIDYTGKRVVEAVKKLRAKSPEYEMKNRT